MVHVRLNEREANPNPYINFINTLPLQNAALEDDSRQLLRALAAQVKPVMKSHGFVVNSFEEYQYNKVFAGRNWNNGEVVEIVLRGPSGVHYPNSWLLGTLCHELAHIKHMNHGPAFQALWSQLRREVRELQSRGYYGDGYWSSGTRLADSAVVGGFSADAGALPEYMCGGAQKRQRPASLHRRRRQATGPSNYTGAQSAKKRKAGSRVTAQGTFKGGGHALNEDLIDDEKKKGAGFRKKAVSKRAREERALAAEKRLQTLLSKTGSRSPSPNPGDGSNGEEETDKDRRRAMLDTMQQSDLDTLRTSRNTFIDEFFFPLSQPEAGPSGLRSLAGLQDDFEGTGCDVHVLSQAGATAASSSAASTKGKRPLQQSTLDSVIDVDELDTSASSSRPKKRTKVSYGSIVSDEVNFRKKEALGLTGGGRRLGLHPAASAAGALDQLHRQGRNSSSTGASLDTFDGHVRREEPEILDLTQEEPPKRSDSIWTCGVCTLINQPQHLGCDACGTPRGGVSE